LDALLEIRDALNEFASGLHLEEEELPGVFDAELLEISQQLEDRIAREFSQSLLSRACGLEETSTRLVEDPSPEAMAAVLLEFSRLVVEMNSELRLQPEAAEWHLARQYGDIAEHLEGPKPAENQGFKDLPKMLQKSNWLQRELARLAGAADVELARSPAGKGFSQTSAKRWIRKASRGPHGQLSAALDHLQHGIEYRARQVWFLRRAEGEEQSLSQIYVSAHADLFPDFQAGRSESGLALEIAKLKGLTMGLQLPEFALCLETAEWMAHYGLNYLVPPVPSDWAVRDGAALRKLLGSRLSRWYFCAFDHELEPLEMGAAVLRIGRPLFYERVASHALLEYSLLQGIAFARQAAPFYLHAMSSLEKEFSLLFDGYLLRLLYYPRLKTPQGWCDYLSALHELHYGSGGGEELDAFRHVFLMRRGLRSTMEILYRTIESHSRVN
jgi:hypothetical protein